MSQIAFATKIVEFRELLLLYQAMVPFLYSDSQVSPTIEHIVPQRLLREKHGKNTFALNDPYNLCLTTRRANSLRSDYPFLLPTAACLSALRAQPSFETDFRKVGKDSYVSHKRRIFIPRLQDYSLICRATLHCHNKYNIAYDSVVCGGKPVVNYWAKKPTTEKEQFQNVLALYWSVLTNNKQFLKYG